MKSLLITLCVRAPKVLMQPQLRKSYSNYTILQLFVFQKRVACGINFKHFVGARCTAMNILVYKVYYVSLFKEVCTRQYYLHCDSYNVV